MNPEDIYLRIISVLKNEMNMQRVILLEDILNLNPPKKIII